MGLGRPNGDGIPNRALQRFLSDTYVPLKRYMGVYRDIWGYIYIYICRGSRVLGLVVNASVCRVGLAHCKGVPVQCCFTSRSSDHPVALTPELGPQVYGLGPLGFRVQGYYRDSTRNEVMNPYHAYVRHIVGSCNGSLK